MVPVAAAIVLAPALPGVINRVKAFFAGRNGPPVFQLYRDLRVYLSKGAVYSRTTTWVFRAGPMAGLGAVLCALVLTPAGRIPAPVSFEGDMVVLVGLLAFARMATVLAALDTGSSFEGMGASREAMFAVFVEPGLLLALAACLRVTGGTSLSAAAGMATPDFWLGHGGPLALAAGALVVVLLAENSRVPVDDPATHLELTMIHEVMVLDHGGPDFAFIQYGAALKLWISSALVVSFLPWRTGNEWLDIGVFLAATGGVAVLAGVIESTQARLRMIRVPHLLLGAAALALLALIVTAV
jgi:formate hydrogenlyase subunit 4